jgi:hypothetical protein
MRTEDATNNSPTDPERPIASRGDAVKEPLATRKLF